MYEEKVNAQFQPVLSSVLKASGILDNVMLHNFRNDYLLEYDEENALMHSYTDTIDRYSMCGSDKLQMTLKHCCDSTTSTDSKTALTAVVGGQTVEKRRDDDESKHNIPLSRIGFIQYIVNGMDVSKKILLKVTKISNSIYDHLITNTKFFNVKRCRTKLLTHVKMTIQNFVIENMRNTIVKQHNKIPKYIKNAILSKCVRKSSPTHYSSHPIQQSRARSLLNFQYKKPVTVYKQKNENQISHKRRLKYENSVVFGIDDGDDCCSDQKDASV